MNDRDRVRMHLAEIWTSVILVQTGTLLLVGAEYPGIFPGQRQQHRSRELSNYSGKRASGTTTEPSCEELRAMWRYSKRQSRAAESSNELPVYRDPFSYNLWEAYPSRSPSTGYRDEYAGPARSRGAGGVPIYGKLVHKAPAGSRLRNGMPERARAFEEVARLYGTVNRHPPSQRRRLTSFRVAGGGGGGGSSGGRGHIAENNEENDLDASVPQTGSFQHLKELILTERARELQEQRRVEEMAARAAVLKEMTSGNRQGTNVRESRNSNLLSSVKRYEDPINYNFADTQYTADVAGNGPALSAGEHYGQEYMLR
ncbi:PREDICTED: uncharacterized protein LOC105361651 [Ceratosolen solmsi marchali]|uniref:Uncharacterized protein LOC105361651 n=1 Tax=Ceratosolen solmsi marchali TaxID=326594 RepID=A0AAJ7DUT2_9HYME|nr:PREDICTED: uncharacterized protein LOC105361651 [Ceratosolen solmsi marchali]